jgi:hypothetical protein
MATITLCILNDYTSVAGPYSDRLLSSGHVARSKVICHHTITALVSKGHLVVENVIFY